MGRRKIELDPVKMHELASQGLNHTEMAKELGVSHVTLTRRMADLYMKKGLLLEYSANPPTNLFAGTDS